MRFETENTTTLRLASNGGTFRPTLGQGPAGADGSNVLPTAEAIAAFLAESDIYGGLAPLIEVVDTGYPARPDVPMVIWRGWTDPTADEAFVSGVDLWSEADEPVGPQDQWFTDFSTDTAGAPPAGFTSRWDAFTSTNVFDDSGTKILRLVKNSGVTHALYSWDAIPDSADVEIVVKYRSGVDLTVPAANRDLRIVGGRATGTSHATSTAYQGRLFMVTSEATPNGMIYKQIAAGGTNWVISSTGVDLADYLNQGWNWMRLRIQGTTISSKYWPDGGAEPGTWGITGTDTAIAGVGKVGPVLYITGTQDIGCIGVGIDGATAPVSA